MIARRPLRTLQGRVLATLEPKAKHPALATRTQGSAGVSQRERIRKRDRYLCQACLREGQTRALAHIDHKVPLWEGGSDADENLEGLCLPHHKAKTTEEDKRRPRPPTSR